MWGRHYFTSSSDPRGTLVTYCGGESLYLLLWSQSKTSHLLWWRHHFTSSSDQRKTLVTYCGEDITLPHPLIPEWHESLIVGREDRDVTLPQLYTLYQLKGSQLTLRTLLLDSYTVCGLYSLDQVCNDAPRAVVYSFFLCDVTKNLSHLGLSNQRCKRWNDW